ncbi:MAG: hypothetical protein J6I53_07110 [Treponema sp.]|nr:hypothetical protein [Treponema sp.]
MKKVELYVCEVCGTQYKEKIKCSECEKSHVLPTQIIGWKYMPKTFNGGYPIRITVRMADGKDITYKR